MRWTMYHILDVQITTESEYRTSSITKHSFTPTYETYAVRVVVGSPGTYGVETQSGGYTHQGAFSSIQIMTYSLQTKQI